MSATFFQCWYWERKLRPVLLLVGSLLPFRTFRFGNTLCRVLRLVHFIYVNHLLGLLRVFRKIKICLLFLLLSFFSFFFFLFFAFFSRGRFENKLRKNQTWSDAWLWTFFRKRTLLGNEILIHVFIFVLFSISFFHNWKEKSYLLPEELYI